MDWVAIQEFMKFTNNLSDKEILLGHVNHWANFRSKEIIVLRIVPIDIGFKYNLSTKLNHFKDFKPDFKQRNVVFRRTAAGLQRGAGHIQNSFRRARGLPPGVPAPEEPGPPTRPYGARGGARRYPGRAGHHPPGGPGGQGHPHHGGSGQPSPSGFQEGPGQFQSPVQPQAVPSVSAHTPDGPGHSDLHPAYLPVSAFDEYIRLPLIIG